MESCPLDKVIVMPALKVMMSPVAAALVMAARKLPAPESALLVTVMTAKL